MTVPGGGGSDESVDLLSDDGTPVRLKVRPRASCTGHTLVIHHMPIIVYRVNLLMLVSNPDRPQAPG
jgi:hypothetical protein